MQPKTMERQLHKDRYDKDLDVNDDFPANSNTPNIEEVQIRTSFQQGISFPEKMIWQPGKQPNITPKKQRKSSISQELSSQQQGDELRISQTKQQIPKGPNNQEEEQVNERDYVLEDRSKYKHVSYTELEQQDVMRRQREKEELRKKKETQRKKKGLGTSNRGITEEEIEFDRIRNKLRNTYKRKMPPSGIQTINLDEYLPEDNKSKHSDYGSNEKESQSQVSSARSQIDLLTGHSTVWLFIITHLTHQIKQKLHSIYRSHIESQYSIPHCRTAASSIQYFTNSRHSKFKIIVDLDNYLEFQALVTEHKLSKKIISVHIYNTDDVNGVKRIVELKRLCKERKMLAGGERDLAGLLTKVQQDVEDGNRFVLQNENIEQVKVAGKLPTWLVLTGEDKSQINEYRLALYGAIKLTDQKQRQQKLQQFSSLVMLNYEEDQQEMSNLTQYLAIDHISAPVEAKHKSILQFYVRQSFYYKLTNSRLRICRKVQHFSPLAIPFNQNYHAIKHYYNQMLEKNNDTIPAYTLYRGAPVKKGELNLLKKGSYIELLGFVSTSKNEQIVREKFLTKSDYYLFVITVRPVKLNVQTKMLDNGFVDLAMFGIAPEEYQDEEEVLMNALNVYRVKEVVLQKDAEDGVGKVFLEYGSILQLYQKDQAELTEGETSVLQNYRYCIKQLNEIQDHGDVLMKAQEFDKCKDYFKDQVQKQETIRNLNKLAEAHYFCGQSDEARENAIRSLQKYEEEVEQYRNLDRETCMKIFAIHEKNAEILLEKEDTHNAIRAINCELNLIDEEKDWFLKAEKLRQRGEIAFKEGRVIESEKDLKESERILVSKKESFNLRRKQIESKYFWKYITGCCMSKNRIQLDAQRQRQLELIDMGEKQMQKMTKKIQHLLLAINEDSLSVARFIGDKKAFQDCVRKGREYFLELGQSVQSNPLEIAKVKVIEAKLQNSLKQLEHVENSYKLMDEAIEIVQEAFPKNEKVGEYRTILGMFKKKEYMQNLSVPEDQAAQNQIMKQSKAWFGSKKKVFDQQAIEQHADRPRFDYVEQENIYKEVKRNFKKALEIMLSHQSEEHPSVLSVRNHLGDIEYEHSQMKESRDQALNVLATVTGTRHTQGVKSALLLAKIYLSRGELKTAFEQVNKSQQILHKAIVKEDSNAVYIALFQSSPLYLQTQLWRCKVYNRQMEHALALEGVIKLQKLAKKKLRNVDGVGYLAQIYEEYGNILIYMQENRVDFEDYYIKAIKLRENEMGRINVQNATVYCTLFKYLLFVEDIQTAQQYLDESLGIFSRFPVDHPAYWVEQASIAYLSQKRNDQQSQLKFLERALNLVEKRYSKSHISYMKLKLKYAQALKKTGNYSLAIRQFESLGSMVEQNIRISLAWSNQKIADSRFTEPKDDEKVGIGQKVERELKDTQAKLLKQTGQLQMSMEKNRKIDPQHSIVLEDDHRQQSNQMILGNTKSMAQIQYLAPTEDNSRKVIPSSTSIESPMRQNNSQKKKLHEQSGIQLTDFNY